MRRDVIIDLGMHTGQDTIFFLKKGFRVIAVEANPLLVGAARRSFRKWVERGRLEILHCAIDSQHGKAEFFINQTDNAWSSLVPDIGARGGRFETVQVPTRPLADILREHGVPYYLKIDIEGKDLTALKGVAEFTERPQYISVENGFDVLQDHLTALGYKRFKWVNQAHVPRQRLPIIPREGRFCVHRFELGASGAFGEEAPGRWLCAKEARKVIAEHWSRPDLDADTHGWFDLHAGR